jgi:hypothetical protein
MVNPTTKWAPILSAWSGQNGDWGGPEGSKRFLLFLLMTAALRFLLHCAAGLLAYINTLANAFRRTLFLTEGTLKENSPDEPAKTGKSASRTKPPSQLSRRTFLGNIATVGIATTAAPLLQVGELDAQQVHQPTTDVAEAPTSAGTIPVSLKINGQTKNLQIEPRVTLLDALREHLNSGTVAPCCVVLRK